MWEGERVRMCGVRVCICDVCGWGDQVHNKLQIDLRHVLLALT